MNVHGEGEENVDEIQKEMRQNKEKRDGKITPKGSTLSFQSPNPQRKQSRHGIIN